MTRLRILKLQLCLLATESDILLYKVAVVCVKFSGNGELVVSIA